MDEELRGASNHNMEQNDISADQPEVVESTSTPSSPAGSEPGEVDAPQSPASQTTPETISGEGSEGPAEAADTSNKATPVSPMPADINENDRTWAMLAYIGQIVLPLIPPIIILMVEPNRHRPFQRYHALHALAFGIAAAVYEVFLAALIIFFLGSGILLCLGLLLVPTLFLPYILVIWYGIQAYQGRYFEIPILTTFLREQQLLK